jgi:lysophospholipase L1-like esterase
VYKISELDVKIVCVGDSLTRGQISADYVGRLRAQLPDAMFVNAGVNQELSPGVLGRLDDVIAHDPDVVTVLIGTNHVRYSLSDHDAQRLQRRWKLTRPLTPESYRADLHAIVARLKQTRARVALLSPPVVGEALDSTPLLRSIAYSHIVKEVAFEGGVAYLPLNERMLAFLQAAGREPRTHFRPGISLTVTAALQHFLLRRSFDAISRSRGLQLTTDTLHLNETGAQMIADLVAEFLGTLEEG